MRPLKRCYYPKKISRFPADYVERERMASKLEIILTVKTYQSPVYACFNIMRREKLWEL